MRAVFAFWLLLGFFQAPSHAAVAVDTRQLQLEFSPFGDLTSLTACLPSCSVPGARRQQFTSYRGFLTANRNTNSLFELQRRNGERSIELLFTNLVSGEARRWRIPHGGYQLGVELTRPEGLVMAAGQALERPAGAGFTAWLESIRLLELTEDGLAQYDPEEGVGPLDAGGDWIGFRNRYWAAMIKPEGQEQARVPAAADVADLKWELAGADAASARYTVFAGPVTDKALSAADRELAALAWSDLPPGLRWLGKALHAMLGWMHGLVAQWGMAIMLLAVAVYLLLWPLTRFADRQQSEVRRVESRLAPKIREIKRESRGEEQAERILALYKSEGVHPLYSLKGLLGLLILAPVFISVFHSLARNPWLEGQSFLWVDDLAQPDAALHLPTSLPLLGDGLNLLPLVMVLAGFASGWLQHRQVLAAESRRRLNRRLAWTSVLFLVLFYTLPSGVVLYWTAVSMFMLLERLVIRPPEGPADVAGNRI